MKIYRMLCILMYLCCCQAINAQKKLSTGNDPVAQMKSLYVMPVVGPPVIDMPAVPTVSRPTLKAFDIKKTISDANMRCEVLKKTPSLELDGERKNDEEVALEWKTANTMNGRRFDVERSFGDTLHFEKINNVWAKNNRTKARYHLPDQNNFAQVSYYRVRLWLEDGQGRYSNTVAVEGYTNIQFDIFPNPATAGIKVMLLTEVAGPATLSLYNSAGVMVNRQITNLSTGNNTRYMNIQALPAGNYLLKAAMPGKKVQTGKLVKF